VVHTERPAGAEARGQALFVACRPGSGRRLACLGDVRLRPVRAEWVSWAPVMRLAMLR
jgi:hypothetical protein